MATTFVKEFVHAGVENLADQLSGTAVAVAGKSGLVRAAFVSSDGTNSATLKGRRSGKEVIPSGSKALQRTVADYSAQISDAFIYEAFVDPGEELDLAVAAATASTSAIAVRLD